MNGYKLKVGADVAEDFLIERVIKKKADINTISAWLEKYMISAD
jgi:methanogenic corrinoid protein MtbC1